MQSLHHRADYLMLCICSRSLLQVTTGASNDLQQVASIAKRMVTQWGMSDKVGQLVIGSNQGGKLHTLSLITAYC
jgi:ATP-dependent Zn protease